MPLPRFDPLTPPSSQPDSRQVPTRDFLTPAAFIFLYENQLFLTFRQRTVAVWNFRGEKVFLKGGGGGAGGGGGGVCGAKGEGKWGGGEGV